MNVAILLRSSGGAHLDSMAAIDGYVTACQHDAMNTLEQLCG